MEKLMFLPDIFRQSTEIKMSMVFYPRLDCIPWRIIKTGDLQISLRVCPPSQQMIEVGQESAVDERQTDVVRFYQCLADARADRSTAPGIVIDDAMPTDFCNCPWRYLHDDSVDLQQDIQLIAWKVGKMLFQIPGTDHR